MTVCIAIAEKGRVYMGADSMVTAGCLSFRRKLPKVFQSGPFLVGYAGTARIGEILRYAELPIPQGSVERFMNTVFPDSLRKIMDKLGRLHRENDVESIDTKLLIGVHGTVWNSDGHFSFSQPTPAEFAIGVGDEIAMGALYATRKQKPIRRISLALRAASEYGQGVGPPYVLRTLRK